MASFLPPIPPFSSSSNPAEDWRDWKQKFDIFEVATKYHKEDDETRLALLLLVGGPEILRINQTLVFPSAERKFKDVMEQALRQVYRNTTHASYVFHNMNQKAGQTFEAFAHAVAKQADKCAFGTARNRIMDRLVLGINDSALRERLLRVKTVTLANVMDQCMAAQLSKTYVQEMRPPKSVVFALDRRSQPRSQPDDKRKNPSESASSYRHLPQHHANSQRTCSRCGQQHQPQQCPAFGEQCHNCGKPNHYAALCRQPQPPRQRHSDQLRVVRALYEDNGDAPLSLDVLTVRAVHHSPSWLRTIEVNGHNGSFKLDTGSDVNLISADEL